MDQVEVLNKYNKWLTLLSLFLRGHGQSSPPDVLTPTIVLKGCREGNPLKYQNIVVALDGQIVTEENEDISVALGLLLSVYYIFGSQFSKVLKKQ